MVKSFVRIEGLLVQELGLFFRMTAMDVKQYLEKIYKVPVINVRVARAKRKLLTSGRQIRSTSEIPVPLVFVCACVCVCSSVCI